MNCPHCGVPLEVTLTVTSGEAKPSPEFGERSAGAPEMGALLETIDVSQLEEGERNFVIEQRERFAKYGERTRVSPKQLGWLRKLAKKAPKGPQGPTAPPSGFMSDDDVPF